MHTTQSIFEKISLQRSNKTSLWINLLENVYNDLQVVLPGGQSAPYYFDLHFHVQAEKENIHC